MDKGTKIKILDSTFEILLSLVKQTKWIVGIIFLYKGFTESVDNLAGKDTNADISLVYKLFINLVEANVIAWSITGIFFALFIIAIVLYMLEKRQKRKAIKNLGLFRKQYESLIDPERSSSGLTETGKTPS
jgi:hypothetical protein